MHGYAIGGDDTLVSGTGYDFMAGDAAYFMAETAVGGADTFVFAPGGGNDDIADFRQEDDDLIDVSAYGFSSMEDMTITDNNEGDTLIEFGTSGAVNSVTLLGFASELSVDDFVFV
jgi:hypothetical protein